jgi:hypothetical protein
LNSSAELKVGLIVDWAVMIVVLKADLMVFVKVKMVVASKEHYLDGCFEGTKERWFSYWLLECW